MAFQTGWNNLISHVYLSDTVYHEKFTLSHQFPIPDVVCGVVSVFSFSISF